MRTRTHIFVSLLVFTIAFVLPALAAEQTLVLDSGATEVSFLLAATGHDVEGRLYLEAGQIHFDPAAGTASGELRIEAFRTSTDNEKRDKKMHEKVLESEKHPLISFRAERFEGSLNPSGTSKVLLHGTVTLLGQDHPLTLPLELKIENDRVDVRTSFQVPYVRWGLHDPSLFILRVAKVVDVTVVAVGNLETNGDAPATDTVTDTDTDTGTDTDN